MTEDEEYNINLVNTTIDNFLADLDYEWLKDELGHIICDGFCNPESDTCDKCSLYAQLIRLKEAYESHDANLDEIVNELRTAFHLFIHKKLGGK